MRPSRISVPSPRRLVATAAALALAVFVAGGPARADGPANRRTPYLGYVYPAGGRQDSVFSLTAGGQNLGGVSAAFVTGEGVRAVVVRPMRGLTNDEQTALRRAIADVRDARRAVAAGKPVPPRTVTMTTNTAEPIPVELPDYPLLAHLDELSDRALDDVADRYLNASGRRQPNAQMGEQVDLVVTVDAAAAPGPREIRLRAAGGLTNPVRFEVGEPPEVREEYTRSWRPDGAAVLDAPVVLDGQIEPGETDRFRLRARRGDVLDVSVHARSLQPFLADAVPGWFEAVVALQDAGGAELARSSPSDSGDPTLSFTAPADGEYVLSIRDALFRGRDDFVYRAVVDVEGARMRRAGSTRRMDDAADAVAESEPNDDPGHAQRIAPPSVVTGCVDRPGDVDVYRFDGRAGDDVVAEVTAWREGSPLDSTLRLTDAAGRVVAFDDDFEDGEPGTLTRHADSCLRARLPADGAYFLRVADATGHGGPRFRYRLRVGPPRPDFELIVSPASVNVPCGRPVPVRASVVRKDGFDGDVDVEVDSAPTGFVLAGARIPAGRDEVRMTLTAPSVAPDAPVALRFVGRAVVGGATVRRRAIPAQEMMQAFAYRHLVPAQTLLALVLGARRDGPRPETKNADVARLPIGGTAVVEVHAPGFAFRAGVQPVLDDPPPGVVLEQWTEVPGGVRLALRAKDGESRPGAADNLIVEIVQTTTSAAGQTSRTSLGWLPAVAVQVVPR